MHLGQVGFFWLMLIKWFHLTNIKVQFVAVYTLKFLICGNLDLLFSKTLHLIPQNCKASLAKNLIGSKCKKMKLEGQN